MKRMRIGGMVTSGINLFLVCTCLSASPALAKPLCVGDCDGDGVSSIDELVLGVNIGLEMASITECLAFDANGDGEVRVNELMLGVITALGDCATAPPACGGPLDVECPEGEFCEFPEGTCDDPEQIGSCIEVPDACPEIFAPVCGCDGVTYDSDCFRQAAGVSKAMDGDCAPPLTLTVTKTEDTNDGVCDADCSLREAIIAANASLIPAEVTFSVDLFFSYAIPVTFTLTLEGTDEDAAATGDLDITDHLTLTGFATEHLVIDGNGTDHVFHIHPDAIASISGVTIQNGAVGPGSGGGIRNDGGRLSLTGTAVLNNRAEEGDGGGIFNSNGVLRVTNTKVSGNSAEGGGGISNLYGVVTLTDSIVSDNTADGSGGGVLNSGGVITLTKSTVSDNTADGSGGGVLNSGGVITLTKSTVSDNTADGSGGGILSDGTLTLTNSTLGGNSAGDGGAIDNSGGIVELTNCTLNDNSAEGGGGGIFNRQFAEVTLTNTTLSGNSASVAGGISNDGTLMLTNSTLSENSATGIRAGAIMNGLDGTVTLTNTTVSGNSAAEGGVGGIFTMGREVTVRNSIIDNNGLNCVVDDGLLTSGGHNLDDDGSCGLTAEGDLSGVDVHLAPLGDNGGPTETHALCTGPGMPDAVCTAASPAIDAADDEACPDTDQRGAKRPQPFDGASDIGSYEANFPLNVTKTDDTNDGSCDADCSLREAIRAANELPGADAVNVPVGLYVLTLEGEGDDSAVGDLDITGDLTLVGAGAETTVIDGNGTDRVFENGASTSISGVTIQNGTAEPGGGILNRGTLTLTHSTVSDNSVYGIIGGGGIFNRGNLIVTESTVRDNDALGDAVGPAGFGGGISNMGTAELTNTTVSGNRAIGVGGGILNVAVDGPGRVTLRNTTVSGNSAGLGGGGILNAGEATLTNCTLADNSAGGGGGGISNEGTVTVTNTTLSGNSAPNGGGISNRSREVRLVNSIVADSPSGNDCAGNEPITSGGHNLDDDGTCGLTGEGDLSNVDAHLASLGNYGGPTEMHALCTGPSVPDASCVAASPALDAGDNAACPDTDQRGVERPQPPGGFCDIGAYEAE